MKTIITFAFLLLTLSGFCQTTREEVFERTASGHKLVVNTYSGSGNSEKLVKKTIYKEGVELYLKPSLFGIGNQILGMSLKPVVIRYYGAYKEEVTYLGNTTGRTAGEKAMVLCYGPIKEETYDESGKLIKTWKITDEPTELEYFGKRVYTLIP